jgi:RNA polymerase sigma factor (TIGR02999 family)
MESPIQRSTRPSIGRVVGFFVVVMAPRDLAPLLTRAASGEAGVAEETFSAVYDTLRALAHRHLKRSGGNTLNTTALVHEAWLKLVHGEADFQGRAHFFAVAATAMRQILVDHARRRHAQKRGPTPVTSSALENVGQDSNVEELLAIDAILTRLAALDERLARVVEWRFFGGLGEDEIARALDVDVRTVRRDWRKARAFILSELANR